MEIKVELNREDLARLEILTTGIKTDANYMLSRAINRTVDGAKTEFTEAMYSVYNLTKTFIRTKIFTFKTSPTFLNARVWTSDKLLWLKDFKPNILTASEGGVSYRIFRGEALRRKPHWFGFGETGHVFRRTERSKHASGIKYSTRLPWKRFNYGKSGSAHRLPIKKVTAVRIQDAFARPEVAARVNKNIQDRADANLKSQIDSLLSRF